MPIYEYRCEHCGDFEEMERITDPPLARCPRCRRKVRRLISNTSFQLKGSGWYLTDYARAANGSKKEPGEAASGTAEGKAEGKAEGASEKQAETKSEPKSAPKSEPRPKAKPGSAATSEKSAS